MSIGHGGEARIADEFQIRLKGEAALHEVFAKLRALGSDFTPAQIMATRDLLAPRVPHPDAQGAKIWRHLAYGADERHRLDVFAPASGDAPRPVVVFVHGGGFVQGDKGDATAPYYNNFGAWAVREDFVGVTLTYRLAPSNPWPAGAQDLDLAIQWLCANVAQYGGDAARIVLMGQSAGGAHVAGYLARHGAKAGSAVPLAAAVMFSGVYDVENADRSGLHDAYYGADTARWKSQSAVAGLVATPVPCLYTISELDPPQFHRQLAVVYNAFATTRGCSPEVLYLNHHNHVSSVMQLGADIDSLGASLAAFVRRKT